MRRCDFLSSGGKIVFSLGRSAFVTPLRHRTYKSFDIRLFVSLLSPPKMTTNWSMITAEWAILGSNYFLIRLPAPEPWIKRGALISIHLLRCVSKTHTSPSALLFDSPSSSWEPSDSFESLLPFWLAFELEAYWSVLIIVVPPISDSGFCWASSTYSYLSVILLLWSSCCSPF